MEEEGRGDEAQQRMGEHEMPVAREPHLRQAAGPRLDGDSPAGREEGAFGERRPAQVGDRHRDELERALTRYVPGRRWFGAKSRSISHIRVRDAVRSGDDSDEAGIDREQLEPVPSSVGRRRSNIAPVARSIARVRSSHLPREREYSKRLVALGGPSTHRGADACRQRRATLSTETFSVRLHSRPSERRRLSAARREMT